mmetsp:Transcript_38973/g.112529  ORF Transcript_38973/g.112529 Transcript_38973/m.112529 type:complete len:651 (-) Transcript_38973:568-2520(-)
MAGAVELPAAVPDQSAEFMLSHRNSQGEGTSPAPPPHLRTLRCAACLGQLLLVAVVGAATCHYFRGQRPEVSDPGVPVDSEDLPLPRKPPLLDLQDSLQDEEEVPMFPHGLDKQLLLPTDIPKEGRDPEDLPQKLRLLDLQDGLQDKEELPPLPHSLAKQPLPPTDIPKEERKRRKKAYQISACVGNVVAISLYEAGLALQLQAAWEDCSEAQRFARELIVQEIRSQTDMPTLKDILERIRSKSNGTSNETTTTEDPAEKYWEERVKRQELSFLRAKCARDIISVIRDVSIIAAFTQRAVKNCGGPDTDCGYYIAAVMKQVTTLAQAGAEMHLDCPTKLKDAPDSIIYRDLHSCASRVEKIAWNAGGLFTAISRAEDSCTTTEDRGNPLINGLNCAGNIIAAAGYVGSAALWVTAAVKRDCVLSKALRKVDMKTLKKDLRKGELDYLIERLDDERAECGRDISAFVRTLFIAAWKATRAAGWCGGFNSDCGVNILQSAAGLAAASEATARTREKCFRTDLHEHHLDRRVSRARCGVSSSSLSKELFVTAAFGIDAGNSCRNTTYAAVECASRIAKTLAILSFMAEESAQLQRWCILEEDSFECGRALDRLGAAMNFLPRAITGAVVNCDLGLFPRITQPLPLPRRFWVPA